MQCSRDSRSGARANVRDNGTPDEEVTLRRKIIAEFVRD